MMKMESKQNDGVRIPVKERADFAYRCEKGFAFVYWI